ncbi:hypothetical protein ACK83U_22845 (plasmid) [Rhizobium sp. WW22]|uniref:hypothetical protein n=1 Tax=Rhizobium sp. WW22 TaxID=3389070 RepID=UPI000DDB113B
MSAQYEAESTRIALASPECGTSIVPGIAAGQNVESRVRVVLLHNPNARRARGTITSLGYMLQQRYAEQLIALIRTNLRGKG